MDSKSPYTGDHSPLIKLDAKEPRGFSQSGIAIRKSKAYIGRIVLAGSPGTVIKAGPHLGQRERATLLVPSSQTKFRDTVTLQK
jgi:alpha-N-arabinofuranosidase